MFLLVVGLYRWALLSFYVHVCCTLNGDVISASSFEGRFPPLTQLMVSTDGKYLIAGTARQCIGNPAKSGIVVLSLPKLQVLHVWELNTNAGVATFAMSSDDSNIVVSGDDGTLSVLCNPRLSMKMVDQMLRQGWSSTI